MDDRAMYKRSQTLREYVGSFQLCMMFIGLAITSIGAYLINSATSKTISIALLVLGGIITLASFIGCFGAHLEHTGFLNTYSSITAIALILELIIMGLAYTHQTQLDNYGSKSWDFFQQKDSRFLLELEQSIKCCGYESIQDRAVPKTCAAALSVDIGCKQAVVSRIQQCHQYITIAVIFLLATQLIALLVSVILSFIIDRETREEETYMALLSSQNNDHQYSWLNHGESSYHPSSGYFVRNTRSSQRSIPRYGSTPSTKL
ncbi:Tetraspanin family-domain-containing protein [Parasitella parasitica]|nr:Tetraspanin family-domain-containing protein [Parasitella parasitica]